MKNFKESKSEFKQLPVPTGSYQVGIKTFDLIDRNRKDLEYPKGRLIPLWVYFPKNKGPQIPSLKFMEERALDVFGAIEIWKSLKIEVFGKKENNLNFLKKSGKHPVIFLNHGNGCLLSDWASIAEDLASHGYIVIAIQHQLNTDKNDIAEETNRRLINPSNVIDNMLFVFDWLKANNQKIFYNAMNLERIGCIGHSMGANSVILFAATGYKNNCATLFPRDGKKSVKECIIAIDPQRFPFPLNNTYPTFLLFAEKRELEQKSTGEYAFMKRLGHKFIYYKNALHGSFSDHAYVNFPISDPSYRWFSGSAEERIKFFDIMRRDIRNFLQKTLK